MFPGSQILISCLDPGFSLLRRTEIECAKIWKGVFRALELSGRQLKIAEEFVDVETAKQAGRAALGQMVAFVRKHLIF